MRFQENVIPETLRVTLASITFYAVIRRGLLRKLLWARFATIYSVARQSTVGRPFRGVAVLGPRSTDRYGCAVSLRGMPKINCFH